MSDNIKRKMIAHHAICQYHTGEKRQVFYHDKRESTESPKCNLFSLAYIISKKSNVNTNYNLYKFDIYTLIWTTDYADISMFTRYRHRAHDPTAASPIT